MGGKTVNKSIKFSPIDVARYVEPDVYDQVTEFHVKGNFSLFPGVDSRCYLSQASDKALSEIERSEASLWPGLQPAVSLKASRSNIDTKLLRDKSCEHFVDDRKMDFSFVDQLLIDSFCKRNDDSRKRPYPSGGALYPIEVFVCRLSENIENWPSESTVFHLLPLEEKLEAMCDIPVDEIYNALVSNESKRIGRPKFAIVYGLFIEKAIFKYRYRGYRLALMEAGSMYQMADLNAKSLGLVNRTWAGFTDYQVGNLIGLDPRNIAPLVVQFFGYSENIND